MSAKHFSNGNPAQPGGYGPDDERERQLFDAVGDEGYGPDGSVYGSDTSADAGYGSSDAGYGAGETGYGAGNAGYGAGDDSAYGSNAGNPAYGAHAGGHFAGSDAYTDGGSHFAGGSGAGSYADTPSDDVSYSQPAAGVGMNDGFATMPSSDYSRDSGRYTSGGHHHHHHHKHLALKIVLAVLAVVIVAGGVVGFQVYQSVKQAKADAQTVAATGKELANKIKTGDTTGLSADAAKISQTVSKMREETDGPIWQALSHVPTYGSDVAAARELLGVLDDVSANALVPAANNLDGVTMKSLVVDGGIDVETLQTLVNTLSSVSEPIKDAQTRVDAIGDTHIQQVTDLVSTAKSSLDAASTGIDVAQRVAPYLPQMLGANGQTRNYLLMAEQNAELRAAGGFPGAWGILSVTDGKLSMGEIKPVVTMQNQSVQVTDEERYLFTNTSTLKIATRSGDTFGIMDFTRAASLVSEMWTMMYGDHVDGVVALDPVQLQYIMQVVGGVTLPDGTTVDGTNAGKFLSSDAYWNYPYSETDGIFATVAQDVFSKLVDNTNSLDVQKFSEALTKGIDEGRFRLWFANDEENVLPKMLGATGAMPGDPSNPETAVYLNDYTYAKMGWYLDFKVNRGEATQNADGTTSYTMTVTMTNTMDQATLAKAPDGITGQGTGGQKQNTGDIALRVYLVAPAGGSVSNARAQGGGLQLEDSSYEGVPVTFGLLNISPGETCTVTYTVTTPAEAQGKELAVHATPTCGEAQSVIANKQS